jgi:hypothetical protein
MGNVKYLILIFCGWCYKLSIFIGDQHDILPNTEMQYRVAENLVLLHRLESVILPLGRDQLER